MTANDDFDRTLAGWLKSEARSAQAPIGIERVLDITRRRRPRPGWLAHPGSRWIGAAPSIDLGTPGSTLPGLQVRWSIIGIVVLLALTLLGGILIAGRLAPLPPPANPGRLVYIHDGTIYLADWDGSNPVRISGASRGSDSCDEVHLESRMWSPDGRYFAYRSGWGADECTPTVHIHSALGNAVTSFSGGTGWKVGWAPDSKRVVSWGTVDGTIDIHGVDGVLQAEVSLPEGFCVCGDRDPMWAPDGTSVLMNSLLIPLDGAAPRALLGGRQGGTKLGVRDPSTSADGSLVAFAASGSLFLAPVDDLTAGRVLTEQRDLTDPILSPAGDLVAISSSRNPSLDKDGYVISATYDLHVVDATSGQVATVATAGGVGYLAPLAFSPAGERILFRKVDSGWATASLWTVMTDGSDARLLIAGAEWGDWQPSAR